MAATSVTPAPRRRRRWLKITGWFLGSLFVLLVAAYFVGTSSSFFKGVILPRVSKSLNAQVTVSDASISPFKQVILKNLKVQTTGTEPLFAASEVRARYSLFDIIGGNIHVEEAAVVSPKIVIVQNADGTSNLDPITKGQKAAEKPSPPKPQKAAKPPQVDIKKVALTDATIVQIMNHPGGKRDVAEVSHVNLTLEDLKNGTTGKSTLTADVKADRNPPEGQPGSLQARINANFTFALTPDLKPSALKGTARMEVTQATGSLAELASLTQDLNCDISPTEIKEVALHFQRGNARLGEVRVSGPFDMAKTEGRIKVEVVSIDKQVLNLAGASQGIDFGSTTINSTNEIQLTKAGSAVTASGQLTVNRLQLTRTNQTSPPLDLRVDYDVSVDRTDETASLRSLTVDGTQKGNRILHAALSSPMTLAWGKTAGNAIGDSSLNFNITGLDLADWKPFVGEVAPAGIVNLNAKLLAQQGGKAVTFDLDSKIDNLTAGSGTNQITQATVTLQAHGQSPDLKQFKLADYKFQLARQSQPVLTVAGSGTFDQPTGAADVQFALQATLARLLALSPNPELAISSGTIDLKGHLVQKQDAQKQATQAVTGNLVLADLTGKVGKNDFRNFGAAMDLDVLATPQQAQIRKASGKVTEGNNAGGGFDIAGSYDLKTKAAQLTAKLTDFNQYGLRAFLEPLLAEKKLASISINATASTQYNPAGDSSVKADLQVTNLVVTDPKNQFPATPLEARVQVDTSLVKNVAEVRQFSVTLTPTARAKNELRLQGRVDMTQTNAYQGNLQVAADSLDVTRYYDLFAGEKKAEESQAKPARGASSTTTAPATASAGDAEKEPDAISLPLRNFTAGVNIGKFYLREIEITNLLTTVKIDRGHVVLNPFKLALNGSPVTALADLDLGVPGYKYDTSLSLQGVPLAPLVNSFQPERKGKIGGTITAQAKFAGAGTTGASLQKNLAGQFDVSSTNLNLAVENIENRLIRAIVEVVSTVPDLVKNPLSAGTSLVQGITGLKGGLSDDMKRSPVDAILARGTAGSGRIELQQSAIQSPAFRAEVAGTITLAPVLTNSALLLPVSILLERGVAERIRMLSADTPPDAKYAKLPDFLTIKGTVGEPKKDINKVKLGGLALQGAAATGLGGKQTEGVLGGLGNLLTGQRPATNAGPNANATTNPPPAKAPVNDILNQFLKPRKK